jgi:hypothetical protein
LGKKIPPGADIQRLVEWENHQFNEGYWINRFTPFFPPKRTKANWIIAWISFLLIFATFILAALGLITTKQQDLIWPLVIFGLFSIPAILAVIRLRPLPQQTREMTKRKAKTQKETRYTRKPPNKRRDRR